MNNEDRSKLDFDRNDYGMDDNDIEDVNIVPTSRATNPTNEAQSQGVGSSSSQQSGQRHTGGKSVSSGVGGRPPKIRKNQSWVWDHLEKLKEGEMKDDNVDLGPQCRCNYCKIILSCATANGTSHLKRHLNSCPRYLEHMGI